MAALTEIGKYKRLAELFVIAIKTDSDNYEIKTKEAISRLMDHGLSERKAVNFLDGAFKRLDQGVLRTVDQIIKDVSTYFHKSDHPFILAQLQVILEKGTISNTSQDFFDLCSSFLFQNPKK